MSSLVGQHGDCLERGLVSAGRELADPAQVPVRSDREGRDVVGVGVGDVQVPPVGGGSDGYGRRPRVDVTKVDQRAVAAYE